MSRQVKTKCWCGGTIEEDPCHCPCGCREPVESWMRHLGVCDACSHPHASPMIVNPVYLASSGDYSNYGVHCAFTTRGDAEAYCEAMNRAVGRSYEQLFVEERQLWTGVPVIHAAHKEKRNG